MISSENRFTLFRIMLWANWMTRTEPWTGMRLTTKKRVRWQEGRPSHLEGSAREGSLRVVCPLVGDMVLADVSVSGADLGLLGFGELDVVGIALRRIQPEQACGHTLRRCRGDRGCGNQRDQSGRAENEARNAGILDEFQHDASLSVNASSKQSPVYNTLTPKVR